MTHRHKLNPPFTKAKLFDAISGGMAAAFLFSLSFPITASARDPSSSVCQLIQKEKGAAAYLIDGQGNLSKGPIDFGRYAYRYSHRDIYTIPTTYKLIITPGRLKVSSCSENCMVLTATTPLCKRSRTYTVDFSMRDYPRNKTDRSWLPWNEDIPAAVFTVSDPEIDFVELEYRFDSRIVGEIYDPEKPGSK